MRNLKKFLALVLAMMMAFSLMVTANAKDITSVFTDAESVTEEFKTAIDVTNGMGILQGYEDGTYKPKNNIRRSEMTALVYRLATGDVKDEQNDLQKNYVTFKDVSANDWFAGYVGYCENGLIIKGDGAGNFMPNRNVTGYEALAMILRAMGYDKNHEFEGTGWQVRVGYIATQRGILKNINNTNYSATLSLPATRELVAEMIFQAAQKATVVYTPALEYQTADVTGKGNASLGETYFGLDSVTGIIVGNQDTGESMTRINEVKTDANGKAVAPDYYAYFHQAKNFNVWGTDANSAADKSKAVEETTVTTTIDAETGVDMFGHKVTAWYCNAYGVKGATYGKTFALYDNVVKTALVTPVNNATNDDVYDARLSGGTSQLGRAIQAAGFSVDLNNSQAVFNKDFGISGSYLDANKTTVHTDYVQNGKTAIGNKGSDSRLGSLGVANKITSYPLYLVISNNSALTPDMIIAVNVEVSKLVQVNNYATHQTVTVPQASHDGTDTYFNADATNRIAQGALTKTSTKELGDGVVAIKIAGTKVTNQTVEINGIGYTKLAGYTQPTNSPLAGGDTNLFRLSKPTQVVEGIVTQYKGSKVTTADYGASTVSHTGSIVIDGKTIERSLLADAIVSYNTDTSLGQNPTTGAQIAAVGLAREPQTYQKYRAYLDSEGKYIWVEPINERTFVYGTYLDYTTPYASSSYEYTLVGVNEKGEQVKEVVKTFNGNNIDSTNYRGIGPLGNGVTYGVPYRDSASVAGVTPNVYAGFSLGTNGDLLTNDLAGWKWAYGNNGAAGGNHPFGNPLDTNTTTVINRTDARLGMKETGKSDSAPDSWYITENTKVIAVSGAGTDTQKVKVFNGITELLDGGTTVTISHGVNSTARGPLMGGYAYGAMMYYKDSNFTYASNVERAKQIDTLILPMDALTWTGKSNLYFIGNNEKTSEIQVGTNWYTQFTMYQDGVAQNVWVEGRDMDAGDGLDNGVATSASTIGRNGTIGATANDTFYKLTDSGKTLPDGTTVYKIEDRVMGAGGRAGTAVSVTTYATTGYPDTTTQEPVIWGATYWAATYAAQTATINPDTAKSGVSFGITSGFSSAATNAAAKGYNVSGAKVVNLNAANSPTVAAANTGYIWNGITDLGTLNDAASTSSIFVTNRQPVVSCVVSPTDPLTVTTIYVHWNQNVTLQTT